MWNWLGVGFIFYEKFQGKKHMKEMYFHLQ